MKLETIANSTYFSPGPVKILKFAAVISLLCLILAFASQAQISAARRTVAGTVVTNLGEVVPNVAIKITAGASEQTVVSNAGGDFGATIAADEFTLSVSGKNIKPLTFTYKKTDETARLRIEISYILPPIHEELVINASQLEPDIERRNDSIYKDTLFSRDDQIFQTLDSGINAGQHEGGGKSLEIRRFGFNLDHGGVNGGLKVLTDNVQQNQGTQGHGQGYLGALKSLSPELVEVVDIINGPFSAEYGDFSGLGVVHIRTRQSLPQQFTARAQAGSFNTFRSFFAYSPPIKDAAFIAYEHSQTDRAIFLGDLYKTTGRTGDAQKIYEELVKRETPGGDMHRIALFWADHDINLDDALEVARQDRAKNSDLLASDILAWCLYKKGQYSEAKKYALEAMRLKTKNASFHYHLGMIENALGDKKEAARNLKLALETNPAFDLLQAGIAKQKLEELGEK